MNSSGFTFTRVKDQMIQQLLDMGIKDFRVLDALSQVPRHIFLDQALWSRAYENRACLLYTSPSPRDRQKSRMPSSA